MPGDVAGKPASLVEAAKDTVSEFEMEMNPENLLRQSKKEKTSVMTAARVSKRVLK